MSTTKFNPFRPNNITAPGMFVGRLEELKLIERALFQTKNGNPQHFLVQGERGIGKSSLIYYIDKMSTGDFPGLAGGDFKFITVSVDLGGL
ncbi:AAA family ATPase [Methylopila henanensis]|uniref:AAA family ATPase n=1 Tax=Methylopila henanensis TaxID=873516 RepID=A0ABW4KER2_9HYPH